MDGDGGDDGPARQKHRKSSTVDVAVNLYNEHTLYKVWSEWNRDENETVERE